MWAALGNLMNKAKWVCGCGLGKAERFRMGDLFNRISKSLRSLGKREEPESLERRQAPRVICSTPVVWESGRQQGEGQLRELSSKGLKLWSDRAILAGKHIRIRPFLADENLSLTIDVAIGTVIYSRPKNGRFEVGVELVNPERISRYAWIGRMTRSEPRVSAIPQARAAAGLPPLRLVPRGIPFSQPHLLKAEFRGSVEEKNSKF